MECCSIDPGVLPLVLMLNEAGFQTFNSCQGGPGHAFPRPTVQVRNPGQDVEDTREALGAFLVERGTTGFSVKTVAMRQQPATPEPYSHVEVELWR